MSFTCKMSELKSELNFVLYDFFFFAYLSGSYSHTTSLPLSFTTTVPISNEQREKKLIKIFLVFRVL